MKPIYIILLVVFLLGGGGLVAFYVSRKKSSSKKSIPQVPTFERKEESPIVNNKEGKTSTITNKAPVKKSLESDIKVPHVDVGNRRFDYLMHYKGIPYRGVFKEGVTNNIHIKKSFGSFVVKQRMNQETGSVDKPSGLTAKQQKMRGGVTTKGGAVKVGATGKGNVVGISGVTPLQSDWVDLFILDNNEKILEQLSVNLMTGETTKTAKIPKH